MRHFPLGRAGPTHDMLRNRPLYGARCAPLRRYLTIAGVIKKDDADCHCSDYASPPKEVPILVIFRVSPFSMWMAGDILIGASVRDLKFPRGVISTAFRNGPLNYFRGATLVFRGFQLRKKVESIGVSRDDYRGNIHGVNPTHFFRDQRFRRTENKCANSLTSLSVPAFGCARRVTMSRF